MVAMRDERMVSRMVASRVRMKVPLMGKTSVVMTAGQSESTRAASWADWKGARKGISKVGHSADQ